MHIKSVTAQAFGPLVNESIELSPGLTVIHGDNESGKSSWHAAIYAALCGRRRGKGSSLAERDFALRRRPWNGRRWQVSCEVELDDGRSVTLEHDLDGKVACRALDSRGRDVSSDIMYEGAPDGSRWLGLNRRTFAATACVNQAELLRVLDAADALQTDIQRAAATSGEAETAAAALDALRSYTSEHVGKDQVNSRRPLRRAVTELERTRAAADAARLSHADYLCLAVSADEAKAAVVAVRAAREAAEAAEADAERLLQAAELLTTAEGVESRAQTRADEREKSAAAGRAKQQRAHQLAAHVPRAEPTSSSIGDAVAQQVSRALGAWESAPQLDHLTGLSASQLRAQLAELPPVPEGDVVVDPSVERLRDGYLRAAAVVDRDGHIDHSGDCDSSVASAVAFGIPNLHRLADRLAAPVAQIDPQLEAVVADAAHRRDVATAGLQTAEQRESKALSAAAAGGSPAHSGASKWPGLSFASLIGAVLAAIGVMLLVIGQPVPGAVLSVAGLGVSTAALVAGRSTGRKVALGVTTDAEPEVPLAAARVQLASARESSLRAERAYLEAAARLDSARRSASIGAADCRASADEARAAGVPADAAELRILADRAQQELARRDAFERWRLDRDVDEEALRTSRQRLVSALADRGHVDMGEGDVLATFAGYEAACNQRGQQARQARRRTALEEQLGDRIAVEEAAERARHVRRAAMAELHQAAQAAGVDPGPARGPTYAGRGPEDDGRPVSDGGEVGDGRLASDTGDMSDRRLAGGAGEAGGAGLARDLDTRAGGVGTASDSREAGEAGLPRDPGAEAAASQLAEQLRGWLIERAATLGELERQRRDWHELRTLLAGHSLEDLDSEVARELSAAEAARASAELARADVVRIRHQLQDAAAKAGVDVSADRASAINLLAARRAELAQVRQHERQVAEEAARQRGTLAERAAAVPSVAEAEEAAARAGRELDRVRSLEEVLKLTGSYLQTAQEQTYNTLAPVLGSALERWLPEVTRGRYERARVDPETLEVKVATATGSMRPADRLSVGTAEQIYLLLRVALAEHLASKTTVSPLLLDDVTVQADPLRTAAIMLMCKALADEGRQVIVFAQEPSVATWAEEYLDSGRDSLIRLPVRVAA